MIGRNFGDKTSVYFKKSCVIWFLGVLSMMQVGIMVFVKFFAYYFSLLIEKPFNFRVTGMLLLPTKASLCVFVEIIEDSS